MVNPELLQANILSDNKNSGMSRVWAELWADLKFIWKDGGSLGKRGLLRGFFPYLVAT